MKAEEGTVLYGRNFFFFLDFQTAALQKREIHRALVRDRVDVLPSLPLSLSFSKSLELSFLLGAHLPSIGRCHSGTPWVRTLGQPCHMTLSPSS
uniref:Uncharacterized protein n=1 Tax=Anguilla anguilla TaxID=7936 RepID=A0A0E9X2X1_ANGAN